MITFVSGVDTDAGKSIATGWLARRLLGEGRRVITQKLVQTGNVGASEDIARHRAMMGCGPLPEDAEGLTAPAIFSYPCSPHLAARLDGRSVDAGKIRAAAAALAERYDEVLVEGAGGLMAPLSEDLLTIDFVRAQGWPVIFVTGGVLGSISQTLLAFEAMRARGLPVARILYNRWPGRGDRVIDDESCAYLRRAAARLFPQALWEELPVLGGTAREPAVASPCPCPRQGATPAVPAASLAGMPTAGAPWLREGEASCARFFGEGCADGRPLSEGSASGIPAGEAAGAKGVSPCEGGTTTAIPSSPRPFTPPASRPTRRTFPVNLLLDDALALVVGGGRVGLRKTRALLEAGARVRLVCPDALGAFEGLEGVERHARCFVPGDVEGCRVAVACTDDRRVNRAVLEAARAARVPCCCADGHWAEGDFIVPATLRTEGLLVAVSTNGRSCRTAKEVKDALARRLARCSPGTLFVHGIDAAVPLPPRAELSNRLSFLSGLYGWMFLTTCNRTELVAWAAPELIASGLLSHALHLPAGAYAFSGEAAMRHLTMVLAGMRARMVGEFHIVGQVRDAFDAARAAGWAHGPLQNAYAEALRRAQAVRAAVAPHLPRVEVEELALEGAKGRVVVAGTGALGRAAVAKAHARGLPVTVLFHRRPLPGEDCRPLAEWREAVRGADRLVACLAVSAPLFEADALGLPAYDLGAPRNIRGDRGVRDLDDLRGDYLRRTGRLETLHAIADQAYEEVCRG